MALQGGNLRAFSTLLCNSSASYAANRCTQQQTAPAVHMYTDYQVQEQKNYSHNKWSTNDEVHSPWQAVQYIQYIKIIQEKESKNLW